MPDKAARAQHINGELRAMRLRVTIGRHLEDQGMVTRTATSPRSRRSPPGSACRSRPSISTRSCQRGPASEFSPGAPTHPRR